MTSAMAAVPAGIDDVTAAWLSQALGVDVGDVRAERIAQDSGFSAHLYRVHLSGPHAPDSVIVKLPADELARGGMEMLGGYRREIDFYRHVVGRASGAPLGAPHCYAARMDGEAFVLVLEDLRQWHNADHLVGLTMAQARQAIGELAALHRWSSTADPTVLERFPSIDSPLTRDILLPVFDAGWDLYRRDVDAPMPTTIERLIPRFVEYAAAALAVLGRRNTLLHGDIRADNMFFADDGRLKVVDFQLAVRGAGVADIAYLVSQGLPTEVRRGNDEQLVREYLELVDDPTYSFDEAWRDYRLATIMQLHMPVVAMLTLDAAPPRSRQLCHALIERSLATIEDIDALLEFDREQFDREVFDREDRDR